MYQKTKEEILQEKAKNALEEYQNADIGEGISPAYNILRYSKKGMYAEKSSLINEISIQDAAQVIVFAMESPFNSDNNVKGFKDIDWQSVYDKMTQDHNESIEITGIHDWPSLLMTALREIANKDKNS